MRKPETIKVADFEAAAIAVAVGLQPNATPTDAARASGLPAQTVRDLLDRVKDKYRPLADEVRDFTTKDIIFKLNQRIESAFEALDDEKLEGSSAMQLATIIGILIDKRQLLSGEPTQILSIEDRREVDDLGAALMRELNRRNMVVDAIPTPGGGYEVDVSPREADGR